MLCKKILVTGGAGFIGSSFIRYGLQQNLCDKIVNLDLLTYAGSLENLRAIENDPRYFFMRGDICDEKWVEELCIAHHIDGIVHFAAESHVDRSIEGPKTFFRTNVEGTLNLLEIVRRHPHIHFHHISTDEVYGSTIDGSFSESSPYRPNSPYSASKAASDHFVRAYAHTYGLSTTLSHCSNNYGPHQHGEKFIPRMIYSCLRKEPFPVYGKGINVRDWLYVDDHAEAIWKILEKGSRGEIYTIGGESEMRNIDLLQLIIAQFARLKEEDSAVYHDLITFVPDRPGHDLRYSIDCSKIKTELGWSPRHSLIEGINNTIQWYVQNENRLHHSGPPEVYALSAQDAHRP